MGAVSQTMTSSSDIENVSTLIVARNMLSAVAATRLKFYASVTNRKFNNPKSQKNYLIFLVTLKVFPTNLFVQCRVYYDTV